MQLIYNVQKSIIENDIEGVNDGGCGFFAFYMANELDRLGIPYKIKVVDRIKLGSCSINRKKEFIRKFLKEGFPVRSQKISFQHCFIEVKYRGANLEFDSDLSNQDEEWYYDDADYSGYFTKQELKIAIRYAQWNKRYKKSQNKKLRAAIRAAIKPLAK